jgi:hypothetical protein
VIIADLNLDAAQHAAGALADAKSAIAVGMDVANEDQVNAGVDQTLATFGRMTFSHQTRAFRSYIQSRTFA